MIDLSKWNFSGPHGACGAKTRKSTPCKRRDVYRNGRCRMHGGPSTGPRTEAGKQQSRINGMKGGRPRKNPTTCDGNKS